MREVRKRDTHVAWHSEKLIAFSKQDSNRHFLFKIFKYLNEKNLKTNNNGSHSVHDLMLRPFETAVRELVT